MVRKRVTTRILAAARIRSCTRISLLTAAAISGVSPGASAASRSGVASSESSQSRSSPTVKPVDRRKGLRVVRVRDQPGDFVLLVGNDLFGKEVRQRQVGEGKLGGHALLGDGPQHPPARLRCAGAWLSRAVRAGVERVAGVADGMGEGMGWNYRRGEQLMNERPLIAQILKVVRFLQNAGNFLKWRPKSGSMQKFKATAFTKWSFPHRR